MSTDTTTMDLSPLLLPVADVARRIGVSPRKVWTMNQTGELGPLPVHLGGRTLWVDEEIAQWVKAHCPHREMWLAVSRRR